MFGLVHVLLGLFPRSLFLGIALVWQRCNDPCISFFLGVISGPVGVGFSDYLVLPYMEICSEGRSVVRCLLWVLLLGDKLGHGGVLNLLVFLLLSFLSFVQQKELHLGQLVCLPGLFSFGFKFLVQLVCERLDLLGHKQFGRLGLGFQHFV